jgi:hypothetical protein
MGSWTFPCRRWQTSGVVTGLVDGQCVDMETERTRADREWTGGQPETYVERQRDRRIDSLANS